MASTRIYIAPNTPISQGEFERFVKQFAERVPLNSLSLCCSLVAEWEKYGTNPASITDCYDITLPKSKGLKARVESGGGVYCMYAKHKDSDSIECFYVGVSVGNVYDRLAIHLHGDIRDKEGFRPGKQKAYTWLGEAVEVVICYATIQHGNDEKSRSRLELLEDCLTILLRPKFLIVTAQ